jgi:hypothetical protein
MVSHNFAMQSAFIVMKVERRRYKGEHMAAISPKAWKFCYGHWEEIEDILCFEGSDDKYQRIELAGYDVRKAIVLGRWGSKLRISIYLETLKAYYQDKNVKKPQYPYYVSISFFYQHKSIYVVDFPSLFLLLSQIYPLFIAEQIR